MKTATDLVLRSPATGDIALIELKNRRELTEDIATSFRRNVLIHGDYQRVPYFVLVSQDTGYIWSPDDEPRSDAAPSDAFDVRDIIRHYDPEFDSAVRLRESELILIIEQWIDDLIHGDMSTVPDPGNAMRRSGLLDALRSQSQSVEVLD